MPIYEFYCEHCNTIFNFFSKTVNTTKKPKCPKCKTRKLARQMSLFSMTKKEADADSSSEDLPFDENKMEQAMKMLESEAGNIDENDPRQAANLMRKLTDMTGMDLGDGMNEALLRMENGEDPDVIEQEMGNLLENEDPFTMADKKSSSNKTKKKAPEKDETLYDL